MGEARRRREDREAGRPWAEDLPRVSPRAGQFLGDDGEVRVVRGGWPCAEHVPGGEGEVRYLATSCLLVGAWSLVRVEDLLTAACSLVVVLSCYLLLPREGGG